MKCLSSDMPHTGRCGNHSLLINLVIVLTVPHMPILVSGSGPHLVYLFWFSPSTAGSDFGIRYVRLVGQQGGPQVFQICHRSRNAEWSLKSCRLLHTKFGYPAAVRCLCGAQDLGCVPAQFVLTAHAFGAWQVFAEFPIRTWTPRVCKIAAQSP